MRRTYFRLFTVIFCFYGCMMRAVLVEVNRMKKDDGQTIDLFSEVHYESPQDDAQQLKDMQEFLVVRDKQSQKRLHMFVEKPAEINKMFGCAPKITTDLHSRLRPLRLQRTKLENIEIRNVANAAQYLLQPGIDPRNVSPKIVWDAAHKQKCVVGDITFANLAGEYKMYKNRFVKKRNKLVSRQHKEVLSEKIEDIKNAYQDLETTQNELHIKKHGRILGYAKLMAQRDDEDSRTTLFSDINHLFSPILELHSVFRMLDKHDIEKLGLVAGSWHVQQVKSLLRTMGVQAAGSYGTTIGDIKPLTKDQLNIFVDQYGFSPSCTVM